MATLEEEPSMGRHIEITSPEHAMPERSIRFLGDVVLEDEPRDLYESIMHMAARAEVQTPADFNFLIHQVLISKVRGVNDKHFVPTDRGVVKPERVTEALTRYYLVFPEANVPQDTPPTNRALRNHLATHIQNAQSHMYSYPEIGLLLRLERDLRTRAGEAEANAALELIAAYGWAIRPDYGAARKALYRSVGMSQMLASERPQQRQ